MVKLMTAALRMFLPISITHCITLCHMIRLNSEKNHDTVDAIILYKSEKWNITIDDVRTSIASLKPGKAGGRSGVLTDHIMHGGHNLHVLVCQLFNSMSCHPVVYNILHWFLSLKINVRY